MIRTGACCIVRTVLNSQALPTDFTYGGIVNWYWRLFEVQLGIIAACIPALRPGYKWSRTKIRTYISSNSKSSHRYFSKEQAQPREQRLEGEKTARHLKAHPANVYSDPPLILQSRETTTVGNLGTEDQSTPREIDLRDSTLVDLESQRKIGPPNCLDEETDERRARHRPSLEVNLRPGFSLDRVDRSLERIDRAILRTVDDAKRHEMYRRGKSYDRYES